MFRDEMPGSYKALYDHVAALLKHLDITLPQYTIISLPGTGGSGYVRGGGKQESLLLREPIDIVTYWYAQPSFGSLIRQDYVRAKSRLVCNIYR